MENIDPLGHSTLETMSFARWYNDWIFSLVKKYVGKTTLEVGSGIGNFTHLLESRSKVTATDINKDYIMRLKKVKSAKTEVGFGDIENNSFFFSKKKFDSIICLNVLEHIRWDGKALSNMNRLLRRGGTLVLLVPAHELLSGKFDKELGHYRRYSLKDVKKRLVNNKFKIKKVTYLNWWGAIGWFIFMKLLNKSYIPKVTVMIFDFLGKLFLLPERIINPPFGLSVLAIAEKK